jgi:hypothetical protein
METYQLHKQQIHKIHAALVPLVYGAETCSATKPREFQVHLRGAHQAETTQLDANRRRAIERLEHEIHQVIPAKCKVFDK